MAWAAHVVRLAFDILESLPLARLVQTPEVALGDVGNDNFALPQPCAVGFDKGVPVFVFFLEFFPCT